MSISDADLRSIIDTGLPETHGPRKRVIVVGAGMAGLVAAYELQRAGHEPVVLEAQQRVGGRVYTLREPFSDGLYAEAGAMRIPRSHNLTMAYIDYFKLPTESQRLGLPPRSEAPRFRGRRRPVLPWVRSRRARGGLHPRPPLDDGPPATVRPADG
jgi:phytoene dehydrogenase-like protein